jgi:hypothetical protein
MTAVRPGDQKTVIILAFQAELTEAGYLPRHPGGTVRPIGATEAADKKATQRARKRAAA